MAGPGQARFYSSTFVQTSLASGISAGALTFNVGTTTGAPGTPFVVSVDQNTASEELMLVTNVSGLTYTVTRGQGGTAAVSHNNGASVVHVMYAQDLTDASAHIGAWDAVHGLSSGSLVVGTTDTQTLTNKTLTSPVINTPTISTPTITGTATTGAITSSGAITGVDFVPTGLGGVSAVSRYVGGTNSGAPVSGTFAVGDFIVDRTGIIWVCTGAGTPGTWMPQINLSATQTLTNKTISAGVFTGAGTGSGSLSLGSFVGGTLFAASGNTGAPNATRYMGATAGGSPTTGTFSTGDLVVDTSNGLTWICSAGGTPGTWIQSGAMGLLSNPVSTTTAGTATSGTTDTLDTVLSTYQFTAIAGQWYHVYLDGMQGNTTVGGDIYELRIRDSGSASAPTTSSTAVAENTWVSVTAGTAGRVNIQMSGIFQAGGNGTHTLGFFAQRSSGTGVFQSVSTALGRSLYVENIR